MGLGFIRRTVRRVSSRAPQRPRAGRYFPSSAVTIRSQPAAMSGTGSLTATFVQGHVMVPTLSGTGSMSVDNGSVLTAVTLKAPQINPSAVTMRVP